jgi:hypothetical protein
MNNYFPDNWVVIFINGDNPIYKLLVGWSGGYLHGDSWRMNSGITSVELKDDKYLFYGSSGSCYVCHKDSYGLRNNNAYIWNQLSNKHGDKIVLMDENTDWLAMDWSN